MQADVVLVADLVAVATPFFKAVGGQRSALSSLVKYVYQVDD